MRYEGAGVIWGGYLGDIWGGFGVNFKNPFINNKKSLSFNFFDFLGLSWACLG
jgi:hypothetical protein